MVKQKSKLFKSFGLAGLLCCIGGSMIGTGCGSAFMTTASASDYTSPVIVGKIETDDVRESSGLSASECQDVLWTHNDAGNDALIFGMDRQGMHLGTWRVENARNVDWESIATFKEPGGKCSLLIADIGDNDKARSEVEIYRIPEPAITPESSASNAANPLLTTPAEVMKLAYADGSKNAEVLLVHPQTGDIYIVTKEKSGPAGVHIIKPRFGDSQTVAKTTRVGDVSVPSDPVGMITGGSFSPDGRRLMLCDKKNGYEFVQADSTAGPDAIWNQQPVVVDLGDRKTGRGRVVRPRRIIALCLKRKETRTALSDQAKAILRVIFFARFEIQKGRD